MCHILALVPNSGEYRAIVTPFEQAHVSAVHVRQLCSLDEMRTCLLGSNAPRDIKYCIINMTLPDAVECLQYAYFALKSAHNPVEFVISGPYDKDNEEVLNFLERSGAPGIPYFQTGSLATKFALPLIERYAA